MGCLVVIAIVAILLAVAWVVFGQRLRTFYVVKRCEWAWKRVADYQNDFELRTELGPLSIPVRGTMWFKRPDRYRIDVGPDQLTVCRFISHGSRAWVYVPSLKVALDVAFAEGDPTDVARSQSPAQWVDQLLGSADARVIGAETAEGRECYVIELTPVPDTKGAIAPLAPPATGRLLDSKVLTGQWERTRIYVSKKTALPVQGMALTDRGNPIVTWTAKSLAVNQGLSDRHFEFDPPEDVTVIEREFDPAHPESLFLPPGDLDAGASWPDVFDALEDEVEEQFEDMFGSGKPDERSSEPSLDSFLEGLEDRLRDESAREGAEAQATGAGSAE